MAVMKVGAAGIETISGAMKRPKKQDGHNHGNYLVATHRVAPTQNPNCQRLYTFDADRYKRTVPDSAKLTAAKLRFATVSAAIKTRKADMMKVVQDQESFLAQRDLPGGKKTMTAWYWYVEGQAYDQALANG